MREVELLKEAMAVYGLSPERAVRFLDVSNITIRRWLKGDNEPNPIYAKAIVAGVEKMKAEFEPKLKMREIRPGVKVSAGWWGNLSGEPSEPTAEQISEEQFDAKIEPLFAQLMAVARETEKPIIASNWTGFVEILSFAVKHGISIP